MLGQDEVLLLDEWIEAVHLSDDDEDLCVGRVEATAPDQQLGCLVVQYLARLQHSDLSIQ